MNRMFSPKKHKHSESRGKYRRRSPDRPTFALRKHLTYGPFIEIDKYAREIVEVNYSGDGHHIVVAGGKQAYVFEGSSRHSIHHTRG